MKKQQGKLSWVKKDKRGLAEESVEDDQKESDEWIDVEGGEQEPKTPVESEDEVEEGRRPNTHQAMPKVSKEERGEKSMS